MEVSTNLINRLSNDKKAPVRLQLQQDNYAEGNNSISSLPPIHSAGLSQVTSNLPVSYSKIGEIEIPGLKNKASVFKLANGQRVIIAPQKGQTFIKTTYNAGSMNETEDIRGISHFIEHNLFNGSKNLAPKEYDKKVSDLGGETNASTSFALTDYYLNLQLIKENSLEEAIMLNAMQTQFPTFPADQLEKEKEPVKSEIDMYKDDPFDVATCKVLKNLFNVNTKSDNFVIGTKDNINSFTRDDVLDYFNTWYTPDNAVTVITGDVNVDETINLVSKYFNKKTDTSKVNQRHYEPIKYNDKPVREDIIQPNAAFADIIMGFAIPEGTSKEDMDKINTLSGILTSSSSRLSKALDKYGVIADFETEKIQNKPDGASAILLHVSSTEEQIEDIIKILYEELAYIADNPPSNEELNNVKKKRMNYIKNIAETSADTNSVLTDMALKNDYNYFTNTINSIQNTTPEDISQTAKKFLDLSKVSMCVSHENTATPESINSQYNSASNTQKTVSFGALHNPKDTLKEEADKIKTFKLANNIETMTIPNNTGTDSFISLSFDTEELNSVKSPAFMVLNELLERGSSFKDYDTYNNILNSKNIGMAFYAGTGGLGAAVNFDDENIYDAMSLIKEVLMSPNFSQTEFDKAKRTIRDSILSEDISAFDKLNNELFPSIEKYASKEERLKQLDELTLSDIQSLYSRIISTSQVSASLSAPLEEKPYLQDIFNNELSYGLPVFKQYTKQHSPSYNIYFPNTEAKTLAAAQEQSQAEIVQAYKYKKSENIDDKAKIALMNIILGDGMSSRLFSDLREDKKLAYTVYSDFLSENDTNAVILYTRTTTESNDPKEGSPDNALKALEGFERNVNLLKNENVSEKELENAKIKCKTQLLNSLETGSDKAAGFIGDKSTPYDIRYNEALFDAIDRVTVDDIRAAANYVFQNPPITSITASQKTLDTLNLKTNN